MRQEIQAIVNWMLNESYTTAYKSKTLLTYWLIYKNVLFRQKNVGHQWWNFLKLTKIFSTKSFSPTKCLLKTMFAYKRGDWSSSWHQQYKLTIELLSFFLFFPWFQVWNTIYKGFNEIEKQTDVCFLMADVNILCSYMRTLSLTYIMIQQQIIFKKTNIDQTNDENYYEVV